MEGGPEGPVVGAIPVAGINGVGGSLASIDGMRMEASVGCRPPLGAGWTRPAGSSARRDAADRPTSISIA